jgi:apolipoprotein N-acyltransferase
VQPSIPQTLIWDSANNTRRFEQLLRLSEQALTNATDVLVWPEAAVPGLARWDTNLYPAITNLVRRHRVWLILGSDDVGRPATPVGPDDFEYYNASFLVNPAGEFVARYVKRNLVIFGEYIPLEHTLPFVKWFTPVQGSFTPGNRVVPFDLAGWGEQPVPAKRSAKTDPREPEAEPQTSPPGVSPREPVKTSVLICFEDTFASLAREAATPDTDFLLNLTNDGWFGEGAAQWQHVATARFRAVENRRPLVRCTNTGLTCWIDSCGRVRDCFRDENGSVYGAGYLTVKIPLLAPGERPAPTFYRRHGDWFGWLCAGLALLRVAVTLARRRA